MGHAQHKAADRLAEADALDALPAYPYRNALPETAPVSGASFCARETSGATGARFCSERVTIMARRCELTGKGVLTGNNVSHANNKTRRRFLPNLLNVTLLSDRLGRSVRLRISANALRTLEHRGGLDAFLVKAKPEELSDRARALRAEIVAKSDEAAA